MPQNQNEQFKTFDQAAQYIDEVRQHYRDENAAYRGTRNEEQQLIAEVTADEAREIVDGAMIGILSIRPLVGVVPVEGLPRDYDTEIQKAGFKWEDFRGEFERLLVGFGVLTHRLHRDGFNVPSFSDLGMKDRMKAGSVLFGDFLEHNALRFGVDSAGVKGTIRKTVHTDDGGVEHQRIIVDKDKARDERDIDRNMRERGFTTDVAAHPAGKISPEKYRELRLAYPEMDKDKFDRDVSFFTNVQKELESRE